ncbi:MAG: polyprenyl synthetase family protein [Halobacteriaceae archaeon]
MQYVEDRRDAVEQRLAAVLDDTKPPELTEEMQSVALSGGKRVRPTLTLLVCEALDGDSDDALDFAAGIELVHNASLVVDDVIDRSDTRRGSKSAWAAYGHGPALLASDGLLGEAFKLFSNDPRAMETVADAMVELGQGEATELTDRPTTETEYMELARRKTGALFRAAAELGAIASDSHPETIRALGDYAEYVGIAFQLRDDVLDEIAASEEIGKPTGVDKKLDRPSILQVTERTPEEVTALARGQSAAALNILDDVDVPDSDARCYLEELARFVVDRDQ